MAQVLALVGRTRSQGLWLQGPRGPGVGVNTLVGGALVQGLPGLVSILWWVRSGHGSSVGLLADKVQFHIWLWGNRGPGVIVGPLLGKPGSLFLWWVRLGLGVARDSGCHMTASLMVGGTMSPTN